MTLLALYEREMMADYFQIWMEDSNSYDPERDFLYTDEHMKNRVWVDHNMVVMFVQRNMPVPVTIEIHDSAPDESLTDWERWQHIAEASIDVPSGELKIFGLNDVEEHYLVLSLNPNTYRVQMYQARLDTLDETGLEGDDHYRIVLWPGEPTEPKALKMWNGN